MIDLQAVFVRDVAELRGINYMSMVRVKALEPTSDTGFVAESHTTFKDVTRVEVNGIPAPFFLEDFTNLLIALPVDMIQAGLTLGSIANVRLIRAGVDSEGNELEVVEEFSELGGPGGTIDLKAKAGSKRVTVDGGVLRLTGQRFDKAVGVYVNRKSVPFTIIDNSNVLCALPKGIVNIEDVEVITTAKSITRTSMFAYLFTDNMSVTTGEFKLVQQFIKMLLTTPGSDVFNKKAGGNLQNWVGQNTPMNNPQALVAKTVLNVITTGLKFSAEQQAAGSLPANEKLADVEVLAVDFDRQDPSIMNLSIRLNTFARRQATIGLMIGTAETAIKDIVEAGI